jgi:hypothetical protein
VRTANRAAEGLYFYTLLGAFREIREMRLLASPCQPPYLSASMQQLGSQWTDFHESRCLETL